MASGPWPWAKGRYLEEDGSLRTVFYNVWLLRFDGDGRCADFVEYWRELPEELHPGR